MTALSLINLGDAPNDGTGDPARTAGEKVNAAIERLNEGADIPVTATGSSEGKTLGDWMADIAALDGTPISEAMAPVLQGSLEEARELLDLDERTPQHFPLEAYAPSITHVAVDTGSGLYRHVPGIYMRSGAGAIAYLFNDSSASESQSGQRAGIRRTSDDGATWSAKVEEFNDSATCSNPLTPGSALQGEVRLAYMDALGEEWATVAQRGAEETAFLLKRDASAGPTVNKWTPKRLMFDSTTMAPVFSSTVTGAAPSGYQLKATIDGVANLAPVFARPVYFDKGPIRFAIPVVLVTTYATLHRLAVLYTTSDDPGDSDWTLSGLVPLGDFGAGEMWEPSIIRTELGVYRMMIRDLSGSENQKYGATESLDCHSWSNAKHLGANVHSDRIEVRRFGSNRYMGVGVSHTTNRNGLVLMVSRDGVLYSEQGLEIGNEIDGTEFVHYSDIDEDSGKIYACFTVAQTGDAAPNEVHFARFASFDEGKLPMMGSVKNAVEDDSAGKESTVSGDILTIPPGSGMMWAPGGLATVFTRTWAVSALPASNPVCLFTIGTGASRKLVTLGADGKIYVDGVDSGITPNDATEKQTIQIMIDRRRRIARVYELEFPIPSFSQLGSGDAYNDQTDTDVSLYFYASGCFDTAIEPDRLTNSLGGLSGHFDSLTVDRRLNVGAGPTLTIASGAITVTHSFHLIDTEGSASADDLDTINGGKDGDLLMLAPVNSARDPTLKHNTGNLLLSSRDRTLGGLQNHILLRKQGSFWYMVGRALDADGVATNFTVGGTLELGNAGDTSIDRARAGVITIEARATPIIVAQSGAPASLTGSTSETTLATVVIPAGMMGANGRVCVVAEFSAASGGAPGNRTARIKFGGTSYVATTLSSSQVSARYQADIWNANSATAQIGHNQAGQWGPNSAAHVTSSVDTASPVTILLTGQLADGGDTITLRGYTVTVYPSP